jgi:tetratricopeptide (TPR) repeat protein
MSEFIRRRLTGLECQVKTLVETGLIERALKAQQDVCRFMDWHLGAESPELAKGLIALAELHHQLDEEKEAESCYRQARDILREELRRSHPDLLVDATPAAGEMDLDAARKLNQLGKLHWLLEEYEPARSTLHKALVICRQTLGDDHPDLAILVNNLGEVYHSLGDFAKTEEHYCRALRILGENLGEDHPDFIRSLQDLVRLYTCG